MTTRQELLPTSLDPLPSVVRRGLVPVVVLSLMSLLSTVGLFSFLTYRLCRWRIKGKLQGSTNQYLVLIYNLLIADMNQAVAFVLPSVYLHENKIDVNSRSCWANGWFVSTGDLASSVFIFAISIHTFLAVVKNRRIGDKAFFFSILTLWVFVYLMAVIGVGLDPHLYTRAGAWCWISPEYRSFRLWLHYFWLFVCMFGTIIIYVLIFLTILARHTTHSDSITEANLVGNRGVSKDAAKYMIIYPMVYVLCTLPLAGGRMAAMTGVLIPYWYYCLSGAAIGSCGWLDVLLYALTRRAVVFSADPPAPEDFGFGSFARRYSGDGFWGTKTTISGPITNCGELNKRRIFHRTPRSSEKHNSEDMYFAPPVDNVIVTKTTVEIQGGDITHSQHPERIHSSRSYRGDEKRLTDTRSNPDEELQCSDCAFLTAWEPIGTKT